jgi:hypothetical protein
MWTKMSSVPSPRVRKPYPRTRLNHFTTARSSPLVGVTVLWVLRRGHLRRTDRRRFVHADDAEGLQALGAVQRLAYDARALVSGLETAAAQARDMQENVGHAAVGHDETVPLRRIEPLDHARDLNEIDWCLVPEFAAKW